MTETTSPLSLHDLRFSYGGPEVLSGLDLSIPAGKITVIMGASGCGKSTLVALAAGLLTPTSGQIDRRVQALAVVFQDPALLPWRSALDNVAFGLSGQDLPRPERLARARAQLSAVGLAPEHHEKLPRQLSGGMRQRVALARALAVEPDLLFCDEPFGALDHEVRIDLRRDLRALHDRAGMTIIFVTHDREEAFDLADQLVVLADGRVAQAGTPAEIAANPVNEAVRKLVCP